MEKSTTIGISSSKPKHSCRPANGAISDRKWADAETRAFLERPQYRPPFANVLRAILVTAMAVAALQIARILFAHV